MKWGRIAAVVFLLFLAVPAYLFGATALTNRFDLDLGVTIYPTLLVWIACAMYAYKALIYRRADWMESLRFALFCGAMFAALAGGVWVGMIASITVFGV
jgi:hypothetical protein